MLAPLIKMRAHLIIFVTFLSVVTAASLNWGAAFAQAGGPALDAADVENLEFFETRIRPVLVEHCAACHAADTEASGGLLLDSRAGWQTGGDSGAAIVVGHPGQSLLLQAMSYEDHDLQMPPEGKLSPAILRDFSAWISNGAVDPRVTDEGGIDRSTPLSVEAAQQHWAYRPIGEVKLPADADLSPIDWLINRELSSAGLFPVHAASEDVLTRRLYFDLTGLPPGGDTATDSEGYDQLVERLLASPQFGEHFARHWMDVVRFAESITLRGFVLPEAWRYRDYLVNSFAEDRPFDQMIREQIAGDLLHSDRLKQRQMELVATGFLTMGNTNLEQQDKAQLEMDYIDEQLEVIGRAFLGQTIGCARCHDHKFDPIPTRDYYALAGIMSSAVALEHANVSKWIERPLPLSDEMTADFDDVAARLDAIKRKLAVAKKRTRGNSASDQRSIPVSELAGVVVDSRDATLVGKWIESVSVGRFVGASYLHDGALEQGEKSATFEPQKLPPGDYVVRVAYTAGENRASNTLVRVFSADGESKQRIDQRQVPLEDDAWISLGTYRFEIGGPAFVSVSNADADGHVIADAAQFLPVQLLKSKATSVTRERKVTELSSEQLAQTQLQREVGQLEHDKDLLEAELKKRPRYLTLIQKYPAQDVAIHLRGDVHHLGEKVPRGVLSAFGESPAIAPQSGGRLELADWLSSAQNPLTARVYANRVWCWLMGQGIVASINNFGTTGMAPTHPELLDWLATELIRSGWSTKHLVRTIVRSEAYRRRSHLSDDVQNQTDPANALYWCGQSRRLSAEQLRDAMLAVSGELDETLGGSLIRPGTKADYDYEHSSTRRSLYQPVFRNSLPELFEAFDFADPSVSVGRRSRSTVATQALVLGNHPWVVARVSAAADRYRTCAEIDDQQALVGKLYRECFYRTPTRDEVATCIEFLQKTNNSAEVDRLNQLIHAMFASIDFRYLE